MKSLTSRVIKASPEAIYRAFTQPEKMELWLAPGEMTAKVREFTPGVGYRMSLTYPANEGHQGKTAELEDSYSARFVELTPFFRIVEAITFDSEDPAFAGEMTMAVTLEDRPEGTEVTIAFGDLPAGISVEDSDQGTRMSLEKLARLVE